MSSHEEIFKNVKVTYNKETGVLFIDDMESDEQLAVFYVMEED